MSNNSNPELNKASSLSPVSPELEAQKRLEDYYTKRQKSARDLVLLVSATGACLLGGFLYSFQKYKREERKGLFTTEAELLRHQPLRSEVPSQSPVRLAFRALLTSNVIMLGAFGIGLFALKQTLGIHSMNDLREAMGIRRHVPVGQKTTEEQLAEIFGTSSTPKTVPTATGDLSGIKPSGFIRGPDTIRDIAQRYVYEEEARRRLQQSASSPAAPNSASNNSA